jgi:hypothetical protein
MGTPICPFAWLRRKLGRLDMVNIDVDCPEI